MTRRPARSRLFRQHLQVTSMELGPRPARASRVRENVVMSCALRWTFAVLAGGSARTWWRWPSWRWRVVRAGSGLA